MILDPGKFRPPKLDQAFYLSRPEMAGARFRMRAEWWTHGTCRLVVPAVKVWVDRPRLCTSWGRTRDAEARRLGRSAMIFMIFKTRIPGDQSMDPLGLSGLHQSHASPHHIPPRHLLSLCGPASHVNVFDSTTTHHNFSSSHFLTYPARLGLASVSRQVSSQLRHRRRRKCHIAPGARVRDQSSPSTPRYEFRLVSTSSHDSPSQQLEVAAY